MKDILTAPWMVEMIRTATNMYNHGWDERNGGNISLLLDEEQVSEYLDVKNIIRTMDTGFAAPPWTENTSLSPEPENISRMSSTPRKSIWAWCT